MLLIIHIIVALMSLLAAGLALFSPSSRMLRYSYGLIFLTVATGTILVILHPAHLLSTCLTGLAYLGIVMTLVVLGRLRMMRS